MDSTVRSEDARRRASSTRLSVSASRLAVISTCATLGYAISAFDIIPLLFYPFLLCLSSLLFILFDRK